MEEVIESYEGCPQKSRGFLGLHKPTSFRESRFQPPSSSVPPSQGLGSTLPVAQFYPPTLSVPTSQGIRLDGGGFSTQRRLPAAVNCLWGAALAHGRTGRVSPLSPTCGGAPPTHAKGHAASAADTLHWGAVRLPACLVRVPFSRVLGTLIKRRQFGIWCRGVATRKGLERFRIGNGTLGGTLENHGTGRPSQPDNGKTVTVSPDRDAAAVVGVTHEVVAVQRFTGVR